MCSLPLEVRRCPHLFFFTEFFSAGVFRDKATEIAAYLGYGGCEIFPKQEEILVERGDIGNFINLPYFDAEQTMRYAVKEDGSEADLTEFLDLIEARRIKPKHFEKLQLGEPVNEFDQWAPCLSHMFSQGIPEGTRNTVMFAAAVGAKKEQPEKWRERLEEINVKYCTPLYQLLKSSLFSLNTRRRNMVSPVTKNPSSRSATKRSAKQKRVE